MSIRSNGASDTLVAALGAALTIGTGDFSFGVWVRHIADRTTVEADMMTIGSEAAAPSTYVYAYADFSGIVYFGGTSSGAIAGGSSLSTVTWYWVVVSRVSGVLHARHFDDSTSTTPIADGSVAAATSYTTLDNVVVSSCIATTRWSDAEFQNAKVHTGVSWSDAQARAESQFYAIQTAGGTDRLAWRLHNLAAGLSEVGGGTAMVNTGCVDGATRPSQLEADPSGATPSLLLPGVNPAVLAMLVR